MTRFLNIREDVIKGLPKMAAMTVVAHGENSPPPTVPGCKILGFKSRNNRTYTREALIKAAHKYEGVKVNLDHNTGTDPRKFSERFGRMINVRMQGDGLYGDLQYNPAHPLAEAFRWWIKNDPTAIGLSHNATAEVQNTATGGEIVTEIRDVDSVDLVADPATTQGLFESYTERTRQMNEDETGIVPPAINTDMDAAPAGDEGEDFATHLGNAIMAIINDASLSAADKRKKVLGALKLMDDNAEPAEPAAAPEPDGDEAAPVPEPIDEDEDTEDVDEADGDDENAQMEQDLLGDEEAPAKAEPFKKKTDESINPKVQALMAELDAYRVKESLGLKKTKLLQKCKEAKIPTEAITTIFVSQLMRLKESAWPTLIADRRAIAGRSTARPTSTSVAVVSESYDTFVTELLNK
jgi:hypothetical protein